jgi:RimJ/RimL family protein N-acetyltransferase
VAEAARQRRIERVRNGLQVTDALEQHLQRNEPFPPRERRPGAQMTAGAEIVPQYLEATRRVHSGLQDIGATLVSLRAEEGNPMGDRSDESSNRQSSLSQPLHTERLTLRAGTAQDARSTYEYRRLEKVSRWLTFLPSDFEEYRITFADPARLAAAVIVELDGETIGDFMLRIEDAWAQTEVADSAHRCQAELGWVLDPVHTGHGYATEAVREMLRFCFEDLGLRRVVANCFADNTDSWRLMERIGMRREAHAVRDSLHRSGEWLDGYTYAILADEWFSAVGAAHDGQRDT